VNRKQKYCKAKTKAGNPCRALPGPDGYCTFHSPARADAQRAAHVRGGKASPTRVLKLDGAATLATAADVKELLAKVMLEVFNAPAAPQNLYRKARTVGYLAGVLLKALELTEIEERLAALEAGYSRNTPKPR
jgi:hypothetical protein